MVSEKVVPLAGAFGERMEASPGEGMPSPRDVMDRCARSGAVLLRSFPFTADSFVSFSDRCCASFSAYVGGGIRFRALNRDSLGAGGTLMSVTGSTQSFPIPLHGEMYYQEQRPDIVWFYCKTPPAEKGQTTVADGCALWEGLSGRSKEVFRSQRLRYVRELGRQDWEMSFMTDDPNELRRLCNINRLTLDLRDDGSARIEYLAPAVHKVSGGREAFINTTMLLWHFERAMMAGLATDVLGADAPTRPPLVVRLEDGSELPEWLMEDVQRVADPLTVKIDWQANDVVLLDNRWVMHGRRKASGKREIMVRLGNLAQAASAS